MKEFKSGQTGFFRLDWTKVFYIMRLFYFFPLFFFQVSIEAQSLNLLEKAKPALPANSVIPAKAGIQLNKSLWDSSNPLFSAYPKKAKRVLLAENTNKTFDPFIDYGEFQDNVAEEESLSFFQHGRSLSVILVGGYEGVTFNMRQIYGDSLFFVGLNISFFINFNIAFQLSGMFPTGHYNSLFNTTWSFFHYGLDMKYYWYKQYLNEEQKFFNPYLIAGPFIFNVKSNLSANQTSQIPITGANPSLRVGNDERAALKQEMDLGLKTGLGLEINLLEPLFISFEITHLYTNFPSFENKDLSKDYSNNRLPPLPESRQNQGLLYWLQYPVRPDVTGIKFYGDLFQITVQAGINF